MLRDERDALSLPYLKNTDDLSADNEAVVRGIARRDGPVPFKQGGFRIYCIYGAVNVNGVE